MNITSVLQNHNGVNDISINIHKTSTLTEKRKKINTKTRCREKKWRPVTALDSAKVQKSSGHQRKPFIQFIIQIKAEKSSFQRWIIEM